MTGAETALKAVAAGLAGAVIGWTGQALTMNGRVGALEAGLSRIELRLDAIAVQLTHSLAPADPSAPSAPATHRKTHP